MPPNTASTSEQGTSPFISMDGSLKAFDQPVFVDPMRSLRCVDNPPSACRELTIEGVGQVLENYFSEKKKALTLLAQ
jgi:hypothetical protein